MDSVTLKKIAYDKLAINLDEMLKHYRQLLDLVRKEKDILIAANMNDLEDNNTHKEQLISKIKYLDSLRMNYASELAHLIGADYEQPRLLEISQKMGGVEGEKLRTMHSALELVINRLSAINKENEIYANSALQSVNSALNNFKDHLSGQKTYQNKGKYKQGPDTSGHLVKREA
ncbi:MAG: flagellar protein FlgN [Pseudobdellovibrio sp.]